MIHMVILQRRSEAEMAKRIRLIHQVHAILKIIVLIRLLETRIYLSMMNWVCKNDIGDMLERNKCWLWGLG